MTETENSLIKHNDHLLLDQFLLRLPNELLRKNFRSAHFTIEKDTTALKTLLKETSTAAVSGRSPPADVLKNIDAMLARTRGLKRKLETYADEERNLHGQTEARIDHLDELYQMVAVDDGRYEAWSRNRLDRIVADYLLRNGFKETATVLAEQKGLEDLVDLGTFSTMARIAKSISNGSVAEALAWCAEHKKELRKIESPLEFQLRLRQYIELIRQGHRNRTEEAMTYAKKYLVPYRAQYPEQVRQACGLLAIPPSSRAGYCYADMYQPAWGPLAKLFALTHNKLLSLPSVPLLHVALSSGLSALKTPACHTHTKEGSPRVHAKGICPICSTELNELAKNVPYAHHTKSHVEPDLLLLPSGRAVGRLRLKEEALKAGLPEGMVKDQSTGRVVPMADLRRVYIT